jgi:hypothetical protein
MSYIPVPVSDCTPVIISHPLPYLLRKRADCVARRIAVLEALMYSKDATKVGLAEWTRWQLLSDHFGITSDSTTAFLYTGAVGVGLRFRMVDESGVFRFGLAPVGPNGELYTDYAESLESFAHCGLSVVAGLCSNTLGLYQGDLPTGFPTPNRALDPHPRRRKRRTSPHVTPGSEYYVWSEESEARWKEEQAAKWSLLESDAAARALEKADTQLDTFRGTVHFRVRAKVLQQCVEGHQCFPHHCHKQLLVASGIHKSDLAGRSRKKGSVLSCLLVVVCYVSADTEVHVTSVACIHSHTQ